MIKITSDGTARGTRVTGEDGAPLRGITKIEISPIEPDQVVRATITFCMVHLEIEAIRQAASQYVEPPHPAEAMGFDAWMRERTDAAHSAYMARHAGGGIDYANAIRLSVNVGSVVGALSRADETIRRAITRALSIPPDILNSGRS